jgi:hypothetical protein
MPGKEFEKPISRREFLIKAVKGLTVVAIGGGIGAESIVLQSKNIPQDQLYKLNNKVETIEKVATSLSNSGQVNQAEEILNSDTYLTLVSERNKIEQQVKNNIARASHSIPLGGFGYLAAFGGIYYFIKSCYEYNERSKIQT